MIAPNLLRAEPGWYAVSYHTKYNKRTALPHKNVAYAPFPWNLRQNSPCLFIGNFPVDIPVWYVRTVLLSLSDWRSETRHIPTFTKK